MQISRKAEYALHALIYISSINGKRTCSINEIAENARIPREYLAKVLKGLTNDGFLTSARGVNGGYRLAKTPQDISFLNVLEATQGPFTVTHTTEKNRYPDYAFWEDVRKRLKVILTEMNLGKIDYDKYRKTFK